MISENRLNQLSYIAIWFFIIGSFMSVSLQAGFHIFLLIPIFFAIKDLKFKSMSKSQIFFWLFSITCIISVMVNQDIEPRGYSTMTKAKYYFIALLAIFPVQRAFDQLIDTEKRKKLFYGMLIVATIAGVAGLIALVIGTNPISFRKACHATRNCGMSGMYMNYSHNLGFFMSMMAGLLVYRDVVKKYVEMKWVYAAFAFNLIALYFTFTRGAWLGFLVAIPFAFLKKQKKIVIYSFFGMLLVGVFLFLAVPKISETFTSADRITSNMERIGTWKAALKAVEERPVFGFGLQNFEPHSKALKEKYHLNNAYFSRHAHNIFLEFLATTGIVGFTFFMLWLIFWFKEMMERADLVGAVMVPLIACFVIASQTQSTFVLADNTFFMTFMYLMSQVRFTNKHA